MGVTPHLRRQTDADPLPMPSAPGISKAITVTSADPDLVDTSFIFDKSITGSPIPTAHSFVISTSTLPTSSASSPSPNAVASIPTSASTSAPSQSSDASVSISVAGVVFTSICGFIALVVFICVAWWLYRRYYNNLVQRAQSSHSAYPQKQREDERRRSRLEPWNRLRDSDDKWETVYQMKDSDTVAPMEKFTMFKRSPSARTAWTHKSEQMFDPQSFAQYLPSLPESKKASVPDDGALLVLPQHASGSSSPSLGMAIPTPAAVNTLNYQPESAEVVQYSDTDSQKSRQGQGQKPPMNAAFATAKHVVSGSNSSTASQERALQSLIAALDFSGAGSTEDGGLKPTTGSSHPPSFISNTSVYSNVDDESIDPFARPAGPAAYAYKHN